MITVIIGFIFIARIMDFYGGEAGGCGGWDMDVAYGPGYRAVE